MKKFGFLSGTTVSSLALAIAAMSGSTAALAQDQAAPAGTPEAAAPGEEIIVTGSRLGRTSFNSPTPVNVVGQDRVQDLNITSVGEALNQIPSFRPLTTPASNSFRSSANIAGRFLDLRGLGSIRTLTLVDGRRHVPTSDDGNFDLNTIPTTMVQRAEVVTGGASAAYGAGAVSGVVNLLLDTKFTGVKGELSYGISDRNDARNYFGSIKAGTTFAGGRGHIVIGAEYSKEGGIGDINTRSWAARNHDFVTNPFWSADPTKSNGLPATVASDNVKTLLNPSGVISTVSPFQGTQFDKSGNLVPFTFGDLYNKAKPSTNMIGGDASLVINYLASGSPLMVATKHYSALGHIEFELTDSITASTGLSYARVTGGPTRGSIRTDTNGAIKIQRDNAFLNPTVAAMMDAAGVKVLPVSRINYELGPNHYSSRNTSWQTFFALKGELFGDWKWDTFYQFGQNKGLQYNANSRQEQRWKDAIDAVRVTAQNVGTSGLAIGSIVCRTTLTTPTNGCIPANVMGAGNVSEAAAAWVNTVAWSTRKYTQHQVAANFRGTLFEGWAGPISAAIGAEYRADSSSGDNDPASKAGAFSQQSWTALPATTQKVTEGYAEINVPVFKDSAIGKSLEIDGAIRRTHYSISGNATTWKVGGVYELNDEYMLRITRSRDIRAPSAEELNPNRRILSLPLDDPKYNVNYFIPTYNGGNPDLKLETANTFTVGAVFQPRWFPKFRLSIDYYDIKVAGAIDLINSQTAVNLCRAGTNPEVCELGTDNNGNPDRILKLYATYQNVSQLHARGIEIVSNYTLDVADIAESVGGTLNFSINGSYVDTLSVAGKELSNFTGNATGITTTVGVPRWRADAVITYEKPTWSVTAHMNYIPGSLQNPDWIGAEQDGYSPYLSNSVTYNHVSSAFYLDLNAKVKLFGEDNHKIELFGGINNVFDKDPPPELRTFGNPLYYSPIGRAYKIGLRADW